MIESYLKWAAYAWSLLTFIAAGAFFFGGEWQTWQYIKSQQPQLLKNGDRVSLSTSGVYLYGNTAAPSAEISVVVGPGRQEWTLQRQ